MTVTGYDDFEVAIRPAAGDGSSWLVHHRHGDYDAVSEPFDRKSITNEELVALTRRLGDQGFDSGTGPPIDQASTFGAKLFAATFTGSIRQAYGSALERAGGQDRGVRIVLNLSACPELMDWPWEFLFDDARFLVLGADSPVVRFLEMPGPARALTLVGPVRMLGLVSSPTDCQPLDTEKERALLEMAVRPLVKAGKAELVWTEHSTLGALNAALEIGPFHIFHYIGHGDLSPEPSPESRLLFCRPEGTHHAIPGSHLATVLGQQSSLRLVVLNCCDSARSASRDPFRGVATAVLRRNIPAVVAMQARISDKAAALFTPHFYNGLLAQGHDVDSALARTRMGLYAGAPEALEWGTPVIFMRTRDGRIFDLPPDDAGTATAGRRVEPGALVTEYPEDLARSGRVEPPPPPQPPPRPPDRPLVEILPGNWVIQMRGPQYGQMTFAFTFAVLPAGQMFEGRATAAPILVEGQWSAAGNQLMMWGARRAGVGIFAGVDPYQEMVTFSIVTPNALQGSTPVGESVAWQRQ